MTSTSINGSITSLLLGIAVLLCSSIIGTDASALYSHSQSVYDPSESLASSTVEEAANEETYNWPAEEDAMVFAHNAIRKEIIDMKQVLDYKLDKLEPWQIDSLQAWWKGHEAHVRFHCQNENGHLFPAMSERVTDFPLDAMEDDHKIIHQKLDELSSLFASLERSNDDILQQLLAAWSAYMQVVFAHFVAEEAEGVTPTRRSFAAKEWAPIIKEFFDLGAKEEFGSLIHAVGGEKEFRTSFMRKRKIPGFVWRLAFKKKNLYYQNSMLKHMDALLGATPPK